MTTTYPRVCWNATIGLPGSVTPARPPSSTIKGCAYQLPTRYVMWGSVAGHEYEPKLCEECSSYKRLGCSWRDSFLDLSWRFLFLRFCSQLGVDFGHHRQQSLRWCCLPIYHPSASQHREVRSSERRPVWEPFPCWYQGLAQRQSPSWRQLSDWTPRTLFCTVDSRNVLQVLKLLRYLLRLKEKWIDWL